MTDPWADYRRSPLVAADTKMKRLLTDADALLIIKDDAEAALSELERYTAQQSFGRDSLPMEIKQALMILREALNPFDRKRIGRAALPEHLKND